MQHTPRFGISHFLSVALRLSVSFQGFRFQRPCTASKNRDKAAAGPVDSDNFYCLPQLLAAHIDASCPWKNHVDMICYGCVNPSGGPVKSSTQIESSLCAKHMKRTSGTVFWVCVCVCVGYVCVCVCVFGFHRLGCTCKRTSGRISANHHQQQHTARTLQRLQNRSRVSSTQRALTKQVKQQQGNNNKLVVCALLTSTRVPPRRALPSPTTLGRFVSPLASSARCGAPLLPLRRCCVIARDLSLPDPQMQWGSCSVEHPWRTNA